MLSAVIEHLAMPALRIDRSGRILEANASFEAGLRNPPVELAGTPLDELSFSNFAISSLFLRLNDMIAEAFDSGRNIDFSHTDNEIAIGCSIIIDAASPEANTCLCIITGTVSERRDLERSISEPQSLADLIPGPAFTLDPEGLVTGWNRDARHAMFGVNDSNLSGMNLYDTVHDEDLDELHAALMVALNGKTETTCEARILHRRRMVYLWHSISTRSIVTGGKPSVIATAHEITKCKHLEESLQISESKFKRLFDSHATVMLLIDARTKAIIDANHAASSFYGWPIDELCTMTLGQLSTKSPQMIDHEIELIRKLGQKIVLSRHRRADGSLHSAVPVQRIAHKLVITHRTTGNHQHTHLLIRHFHRATPLVVFQSHLHNATSRFHSSHKVIPAGHRQRLSESSRHGQRFGRKIDGLFRNLATVTAIAPSRLLEQSHQR